MATINSALETSRPFQDACMQFINNRLDNKSARALVSEYGYEPLLYNTLKILLRELPGAALNAQVKSGVISASEIVAEYTARMRAFVNLPAEELSPAHKYQLKKLDLIARKQFVALYPEWSRQSTVSLLEHLLSSAAQQQAMRLYQPALQTPDGKPIKSAGAFSLLCLFEKPYLTVDARWAAMREMLDVLGTSYYEPSMLPALADVLSYDSTPFCVAPEGFIKVRPAFEMQIRSKALAVFVAERGYRYSAPFGLEVTVVEDNVIFKGDPGGEWRHNNVKQLPYEDQDSSLMFSLCPPGGAPVLVDQGIQPLQWHEPWEWPNVKSASAETRAQMMVWALMDYQQSDSARKMAEALGLPWEIMNDKDATDWMLQDHLDTEAYFLNAFMPVEQNVELPTLFTT